MRLAAVFSRCPNTMSLQAALYPFYDRLTMSSENARRSCPVHSTAFPEAMFNLSQISIRSCNHLCPESWHKFVPFFMLQPRMYISLDTGSAWFHFFEGKKECKVTTFRRSMLQCS